MKALRLSIDVADVTWLPYPRGVIAMEHSHKEGLWPASRTVNWLLVRVDVWRDMKPLMRLCLWAHALTATPAAAISKVATGSAIVGRWRELEG